MAEEVVSSFPFENWASEVRNALQGRGIDAEVGYAGPRAYPVYIDERDSRKATEVLSEIGYFTCAIGSRASMGGVMDWMPLDEEGDIDDLRNDLEKAVEETVQAHAEIRAAEAYSTPNDDESDDGVIVVASFGDAEAQNGDLGPARIPKGYVRIGRGGEIPVVEEEVDLGVVFDVIRQQDPFLKYPEHLIEALLEEIQQKNYKGKNFAYVSVSGEAEFYAPEKEEDGG
jgi:hypothetical protein